jgi:hypothetical protein
MWLDHGVPDLESMSREELIAHARRQDAQITALTRTASNWLHNL